MLRYTGYYRNIILGITWIKQRVEPSSPGSNLNICSLGKCKSLGIRANKTLIRKRLNPKVFTVCDSMIIDKSNNRISEKNIDLSLFSIMRI